MTDFSGIERRVGEECREAGRRQAKELLDGLARQLGYNPESAFFRNDDFHAAAEPLRRFAAERLGQQAFDRVWHEAEKAALEVLKKGNP